MTIVTSGFVDACGLTLDIAGAFFLASSFAFRDRNALAQDTASYYGGNPFVLRSASYSTIEARVGLGFLVLGFSGQFLGASDVFQSGAAHYWWAVLAAGAALFAVSFAIVRAIARTFSQRLVGLSVAKPIRNHLELFESGKQPDLSRACWLYGKALDCDRAKGESDETYFRRLVGFAELQEANAKGPLVV